MSSRIRRVRLSSRELLYLRSASFLSTHLLRVIEGGEELGGGRYQFEVSPELAEQFRSAFTKRLAKVGFDATYEPNREGVLLEELIDRFADA